MESIEPSAEQQRIAALTAQVRRDLGGSAVILGWCGVTLAVQGPANAPTS